MPFPRLPAFAAAFAIALGAAQAEAQQAEYSPDDILQHFNKGLDCPPGAPCVPKRGGTRAICVGTASDCAAQEQSTADTGAFDMLITFDLGSARLSQQARVNLEQFARAMLQPQLSEVVFSIEGHTDARGGDDFNLDLSERRAQAVVEYLEELGVPSERLAPEGFGESKPRDADPFAAINRRVEATIRTR